MEQQNRYHVIVSERAAQIRYAYRFILFEKRYMIIFQIVDDIVYADYIVDCRQDYEWLIR